MSYKIAVASGKGGTGKTTVSVNLFMQLYAQFNGKVKLVDCDVEEPNDMLFFDSAKKQETKEITQLVPYIDKDKCTYCRACATYCEFNAIVVIPVVQFAEVNSGLCHSCGACIVACKHGAIQEQEETIGVVNFYETNKYKGLAEGKLKIGSAMQTMLIKELKEKITDENSIIIYDSPPGTSCSVVETISDANYVVLVAEPTLFGVHDLKLMIKLVRELKIPFGVVVNKAGLGSTSIYELLAQENIALLGEIPFSKEYASLYAEGKITDHVPDNIALSYSRVVDSVTKKIMQHEGNNYFKW